MSFTHPTPKNLEACVTFIRVPRGLQALLFLSLLTGCVNQVVAGKVMTGGGVALVALGILDYAGAFGSSCHTAADGGTSCRGGGHTNSTADIATVSLGAVVATTGAILWALGPAHPESGSRRPAAARTRFDSVKQTAPSVSETDVAPRYDSAGPSDARPARACNPAILAPLGNKMREICDESSSTEADPR
jgi:hypothetical protein